MASSAVDLLAWSRQTSQPVSAKRHSIHHVQDVPDLKGRQIFGTARSLQTPTHPCASLAYQILALFR